MKAEVKMIAAIVAVLAVALTAFVPVADTTDAVSNVPAIWPGQYEAEAADPTAEDTGGSVSEYRYILSGVVKDDTEHQFGMWKYTGTSTDSDQPSMRAPTEPTTDYPFINANWIYDEESGYTYWLDQTDGGNWFTILGATQVELDGKMVSYRIRYDAPVDAGESLDDSELQIKFYNDIVANPVVDPYYEEPYSANVVVTGIEFKKFDLENSDKIETEIGTVYVTGLKIRLTGNYSFGTADMLGFSKIINVPVVIQKLNLSLYDAEFKYPYNGLWQTPVADYADNSNATYYEKGVVVDNPTPYAPVDNSFNLAEVQAEISEIIGEEVTLTLVEDSTVMAYKTNKYVAMTSGEDAVPYVIKYTANNEKINGELTITWWIMPLGIDDLQFNIFDPYYNFDQEVRPKVVITWTEPEDGPRSWEAEDGSKVPWTHMVNADNLDITYIMPDEYPYDYPYDLIPAYEYEYEEDGTTIKMEELKDAKGNVITTVKIDPDTGKPVEKLDPDTGEKIPVLDEDGNPVEKQKVDENGYFVYALVLNDNPYEVHMRYADDFSFVYPPLVENGKFVYDEDGNMVPDLENPVMFDAFFGFDAAGEQTVNYELVPVMEPVYEYETEPVMVPVYKLVDGEKVAIMEDQAVDEYGRLVYEEPLLEQKYYINGQPVYEYKIVNGKAVPDTTKPVMIEVYDCIVDDVVYIHDEVYEFGDFYCLGIEIPKICDDMGIEYQLIPAYDPESDPVPAQSYYKKYLDFAANQVGVPAFSEDDAAAREFVYGIHIVCDTGYYEFDTDDYRAAYLMDEVHVEEGDGDDEDDEVVPTADNLTGPIYSPAFDPEEEGATLVVDPEFVLVDEEFGVPHVDVIGKPYDPEMFNWRILPLPLENEWLDLNLVMPSNNDMPRYQALLTVPAGYQHVTWDAPANIANIKINNPLYTLAEDYAINGPYNDEPGVPECQYGVDAGYQVPIPIDLRTLDIHAFDYADFYGAISITDITYPLMQEFAFDYEGVPVTDSLLPLVMGLSVKDVVICGEADVDDIKQNISLTLVNFMDTQDSFGPDCFKITVFDMTGDLIVDCDKLVGNFKTDSYVVLVSGNMDAGYVGFRVGVFNATVMPSDADGFTVVADPDYKNGVRITGYTGDETEIVIPAFINGKRVTSIGEKAFYGNKDITYVKIGDNVRKVLAKSFANCTNLKAVDFSDSVQRIATYAFYGDKALDRVSFGHGLKQIQSNAFSVDFAVYDFGIEQFMEMEMVGNIQDATQFIDDLEPEIIGAAVGGKRTYSASDVSKLVGDTFILNKDIKALEQYVTGFLTLIELELSIELNSLYLFDGGSIPAEHYKAEEVTDDGALVNPNLEAHGIFPVPEPEPEP